MRETIVESREPPFVWIDVTDPTGVELAELAREYRLHPVALKDCLDPEHLPKFEKLGPLAFLVVRALDEEAPADADNVREMTRKVAIFLGEGSLITIHRKAQPYLEEAKRRALEALKGQERPAYLVTSVLLEAVLMSFRRTLEAAEGAADSFEEKLFDEQDVTGVIRQVYTMKRRVTVIRWMMRHTRDVLQRLAPEAGGLAPVYQHLKETADQFYFIADELIADFNQLLNLQLSMAAHKTNEVVTVLTVFSAFFLPLTFIVGIYGMNFEYMPEIHAWGKWGYPFSWALMIGASAAIAVWFRKKGWM